MKFGFKSLKAAIAVSIVAAASVALAQPGGGGGRGMGGGRDPSLLLAADPVQKELQLSDEQKTAAQKMVGETMQAMTELRGSGASMDEMREKMQERAKENRKKVDELLKPEQRERFDQISLQVAGAGALSRPEVADKLGLNDDQKSKLQKLADDAQAKRMELFSAGPPNDQQEAQDRMQKVQKISDELKGKSMEILTADQKDKFEKMQGKKFEYDPMQMMPAGFGRGMGGPPGGAK